MSKLGSYIIDGKGVHTYSQYQVDDLNGNLPFTAGDTLPSGYEDISSIEGWAAYGEQTGRDYKYVRTEIYKLVTASGWPNMTIPERTIAAQWFVVDKNERDQIFPTETQILIGLDFHKRSIEARTIRFMYASMEVYNRLPKEEANQIVADIKADNLAEQYIEYGREGTAMGDPEGLFDYIMATSGTRYGPSGAVPGVAAQDIHPSGMTKAEFLNQCSQIIVYGNYVLP